MNRIEENERPPPSVVLYGGKGGVGKTTCAAAHGLALSTRDPPAKTLVVSTDPAHSLGDVFERTLGDDPTAVTDTPTAVTGSPTAVTDSPTAVTDTPTAVTDTPTAVTDSLFAVEVGPERGQEAYRVVVGTLAKEFRDAGLRVDEADLERLFETGLIPGGDEVAALEYIARYTGAEYDTVIFDTAPTGHTLRLLDLPEVLGETFAVASEVQRRVRRAARTARSMVIGPAAYWNGRDEPDEVASLRERIVGVDELLHDPTRTRFRVVLTPERMAIAETERLVSRLEDASVPLDSLVVNRHFENTQDCPCDRCRDDAKRHARRRRDIDQAFDLPIRTVPELEGEAQGLDSLPKIGPALVSETDRDG